MSGGARSVETQEPAHGLQCGLLDELGEPRRLVVLELRRQVEGVRRTGQVVAVPSESKHHSVSASDSSLRPHRFFHGGDFSLVTSVSLCLLLTSPRN